MDRITNVTKRDILELFKSGVDLNENSILLESNFQTYAYNGRVNVLEFLKRLYHLDKMQSIDPKYDNAEEEIWQHTVNNSNDYKSCWIFDDDRFPLKSGSDEEYLKFLCEIFHPEVCIGGHLCRKYYDKINSFLRKDKYELYVSNKISERNIYSWRSLSEKEVSSSHFLPFSARQDNPTKVGTISKKIRNDIITIINKYDVVETFQDETGINYSISIRDATIKELNKIYVTKAFNNQKYIETQDLDNFILNNYPNKVFDAIEMFDLLRKESYFSTEINQVLKELGLQILDGKIEASVPDVIIEGPIQDDSLKSLIEQARSFYKEKNNTSLQLAIEKLWDAFERIKTLNGADKKNFVNTIFNNIEGNKNFKDHIDKEYKELTEIGNKFQIRHFETDKILISDRSILEYLYVRCFALLNLTLKFIDEDEH